MLTHAPWSAVPALRHGFLDARECAGATAWEPVVAAAGAPLPVSTPRQVHGTRVAIATPDGARTEADAIVVAGQGRLVGVVTADCVPVLVVSPSQRLAAAVHAGWRGAAAGVLEATVARLGELGAPPSTLEAVVGPAIGGCCYQVGPEVRDAFRARTADGTSPAWSERDGRPHVDLRTVARLLLAETGVRTVAVLGPCTACGHGYFSYRRDGAAAGRQLSFIGWV